MVLDPAIKKNHVSDRKREMLENFVQQVLNRRFPDEPLKRIIDKSEKNKINFACPFCGDSKKRASKKRGNIFLQTSTMKCFNDGCNTWMPIRKFVRIFLEKYNLNLDPTLFDSEIDSQIATGVQEKGSGNSLIDFLIMPKENLISMSDILNRFSLIRADDLPETSNVRRALQERCILQTPNYEDYFYADSRDDKFYIFNVGLKSGKILGFAVRSLRPDVDRKYIIRNYTDLKTIFPGNKIQDELLSKVNTFNNYFNLLNLDFTSPITIVEGQIDSRFIGNCLSTTGISKSLAILSSLGPKKNIRVLFDRDKAGKTEMMKMIEQGYSVFLWNPLIEQLKKKWYSSQDLKDMSRDALKDINDLYKFLAKRSEVTYDSFNEFIAKFFSTSQYDLIFI